MGQPIAVTEKKTPKPGILRFELNRSLTGMAHERYQSAEDAQGDRPPDVLARRLLETGQVATIHMYSNEVTVDLAKGATGDGLLEIIKDLYIHYLPGVQPSIPG
jgi:hypothetical protein